MLIQVMFRDVYKREFNNGPWTYSYCKEEFGELNVGDLVLVNTRFGISLAQVSKLDVKLVNENDRSKLQDVIEICKTKFAEV